MKKITSFIMMVLLCISVFGMTVSAEGEPNITVSSATAAQGDEVTITVDIANNPGIAMLELPISYDTSRLEKVSFTAEGLPGGYVNTTGVWINPGNSDYNGTILTLTFKVLDNAPLGDAAVSVSVKNAANWDEQSVSFAVSNGAVTVTKPVHEHTYGEWVVEKAASCTENGSKYRTCTVADCDEKQTEVIPATGHSLGEWTVIKEATCTAEGTESRKCANCDYSETRAIAKKDHAIGEWTVTKEATCTEEGSESRKCATCDLTETRAIAAKGHSFGEWKVDKEASCGQEGSRSRVCADCGYTETETISGMIHAFDSIHYDDVDHWYTCVCGASTAPEAHYFENSGVCVCGYRKPVSSDPALDKVPQTGDITHVVTTVNVTVIAIFVCAVAAVIFVYKRRNTR